jgi:hypothetical protein
LLLLDGRFEAVLLICGAGEDSSVYLGEFLLSVNPIIMMPVLRDLTQNLTLPAPSPLPCVGLLEVDVLSAMAVEEDLPLSVSLISLS